MRQPDEHRHQPFHLRVAHVVVAGRNQRTQIVEPRQGGVAINAKHLVTRREILDRNGDILNVHAIAIDAHKQGYGASACIPIRLPVRERLVDPRMCQAQDWCRDQNRTLTNPSRSSVTAGVATSRCPCSPMTNGQN